MAYLVGEGGNCCLGDLIAQRIGYYFIINFFKGVLDKTDVACIINIIPIPHLPILRNRVLGLGITLLFL